MAVETSTLVAAKYIGAIGGAVLTAWTLVGRLDAALVEHLDETFATQEQIEHLEKKVDGVNTKIDLILKSVRAQNRKR